MHCGFVFLHEEFGLLHPTCGVLHGGFCVVHGAFRPLHEGFGLVHETFGVVHAAFLKNVRIFLLEFYPHFIRKSMFLPKISKSAARLQQSGSEKQVSGQKL
jgi:hypothetical protein